MTEHPNSAMYKITIQTMWFMAGHRAGHARIETQGDLLECQQGIIAALTIANRRARV